MSSMCGSATSLRSSCATHLEALHQRAPLNNAGAGSNPSHWLISSKERDLLISPQLSRSPKRCDEAMAATVGAAGEQWCHYCLSQGKGSQEAWFLVPNPWNDAFLIIAFYYALPLDHQELRHFQKEYNDFLAKSFWLRKTTADDILNLWQPSVRPYPATKFLCKWLNPKATKSMPNESPRQIHSLRREGWGQFKIVLVEMSHY